MNKAKKARKNLVFKLIAFAVLLAYTLILFGMLGWGFISSFKHALDFSLHSDKLFPTYAGFQWQNYSTAYLIMHIVVDAADGSSRYVYMEEMLFNSFLWVFVGAFLQVFTTMLVAYCCALFSKHTFSKVLYFTVVIAMTLPIIGSLPSQMSVISALGLYDNLLVIPFLKINFMSSYFLVFYGIWMAVPTSYREAAEIDGAGHMTVVFKVLMPFISNTMIAVFILSVIGLWNDYATPMMFLPSNPIVAQGLFDLMNGQSGRDSRINDAVGLAGAFITALPTLALFIIFRERIMTNVTMGGLKG